MTCAALQIPQGSVLEELRGNGEWGVGSGLRRERFGGEPQPNRSAEREWGDRSDIGDRLRDVK